MADVLNNHGANPIERPDPGGEGEEQKYRNHEYGPGETFQNGFFIRRSNPEV